VDFRHVVLGGAVSIMLDGVNKPLGVLMEDRLQGMEWSDVFLVCIFWVGRSGVAMVYMLSLL
jgi:hypothetical protein